MMQQSNLKKEIRIERESFLQSNYKVNSFEKVVAKFKEELESVTFVNNPSLEDQLYTVSKVIPATYLNYRHTTCKTNMTKVKKVIVDMGGANSAFLEKFIDIQQVILAKDLKKLAQKNLSDKLEIAPNEQINIKDEIERVKNIIKNNSFKMNSSNGSQTVAQTRAYTIMYLLGLATGRRMGELLQTLVVYKERKNSKAHYTGLSKLKGDLDRDYLVIEPIGLSVVEIQKYIKEVRLYASKWLKAKGHPSLNELTGSQLNNYFNKAINRVIKRTSPYIPSIDAHYVNSMHDTRHKYAIAGAELFKKALKDNNKKEAKDDSGRIIYESESKTISRILGVTKETADTYSRNK